MTMNLNYNMIVKYGYEQNMTDLLIFDEDTNKDSGQLGSPQAADPTMIGSHGAPYETTYPSLVGNILP